jgi:hypothetical protein
MEPLRNNGTAQEIDHLVDPSNQGYVHEAPLDLRPLVAGLTAQATGVLFKGLVQDSNNDQPTSGAGCGFG